LNKELAKKGDDKLKAEVYKMLRMIKGSFYQFCCRSLAATLLFCTSQVNAETLDETYQKALKEGGTLNLYGTLTPTTAMRSCRFLKSAFPVLKSKITALAATRSSREPFPKRAVEEPSETLFT